jgi:hypothetical protein
VQLLKTCACVPEFVQDRGFILPRNWKDILVAIRDAPLWGPGTDGPTKEPDLYLGTPKCDGSLVLMKKPVMEK